MLVAFGAFAVPQIGLMIPITPGGLGTVDATMIAVMIALGVDAGAATAADLVWRSASLVSQIMVGPSCAHHLEPEGSRALAEREATRHERTGEVES